MYSLQLAAIAFEVFRHQIVRDLVDLPGQEFIYVELELHLDVTGSLLPLEPSPSPPRPQILVLLSS